MMPQPEKSPERQRIEQKVRLDNLTEKLDSQPSDETQISPQEKPRVIPKARRVAAWLILVSSATIALLMLFGAIHTVLGLLGLAMALLFIWAVITLLRPPQAS